MKNISQENYLDQLLNSIDGKRTDGKNETDILEDELVQVHSKQESTASISSEDDFIREFERELAEEGYGQYISEFEKKLDAEQQIKEQPLREQNSMGDMDADRDLFSDDIDSVIQKITGDDFGGSGLDNFSLSGEMDLKDDTFVNNLGETPQSSGGETLDLSSLEAPAGDTLDLSSLEMSGNSLPLTEDGEVDLSGSGTKMLDDILAEEDEFNDISALFSGEADGVAEGAGEIDLFGQQQLQAAESGISENVESGKGKKKKKKSAESGFFQKLAKIFFAEADEVSGTVDLNDTNDMTAQELSAENQQILKELGSLEDTAPAEKKKEKKTKKAKKDAKPKQKKTKAPKPKKPPKPKKKKPVDTTPPLPKKPVIMIFLLVASMAAFVLIGTYLIGYANSFNPAKELFEEGEYADAFELVGGSTPRKEDEEIHNQLKVLSAVQSEYHAYEIFFSMDMQQEALDSLVCAAGRYDVNYDGAVEYGCEDKMDEIKKKVETSLKVHYQTTFEEALQIYSLRDRKEYSQKIMEKLQQLGLD